MSRESLQEETETLCVVPETRGRRTGGTSGFGTGQVQDGTGWPDPRKSPTSLSPALLPGRPLEGRSDRPHRSLVLVLR